jgi:hypothetical protein
LPAAAAVAVAVNPIFLQTLLSENLAAAAAAEVELAAPYLLAVPVVLQLLQVQLDQAFPALAALFLVLESVEEEDKLHLLLQTGSLAVLVAAGVLRVLAPDPLLDLVVPQAGLLVKRREAQPVSQCRGGL